MHNFLVGDHLFRINFDGSSDNALLPRSFKPFEVSDISQDVPTLFVLTVVAGLNNTLSPEREEVANFDWDGYLCIIYTDEGGYSIEITKNGELMSRMTSSSDFSHSKVYLQGNNMPRDSYMLNNFIMMTYAFASSLYGTLLLHASVVINGAKAYLFLGKSGTGKSTHSQLWLDNIPNSELMNDDNPVARIFPDNKVIIYGSPWSGKTPCYKNISAPAGAFVMLEQAPENEIERDSYSRAFASLLSSSSILKHNNRSSRAMCDTIIKIVEVVPVYKLRCRADIEAAGLSYSTIK